MYVEEGDKNMELLIILLSIYSFVSEMISLKKLRFTFFIRYFWVMILFKDLEIFSNEFLNFFILEAISIGSVIYVISYAIVGIFILIFTIDDTTIRRIIYFFAYILVALILYIICLILSVNNILPII